MKKSSTPVYLVIGAALACLGATPAYTQPKINRVPAASTRSVDGTVLFKEYCAVCHGPDARGGGPAADSLKKRPADLTQLTRKNNGKFPGLEVLNTIKGYTPISEHGTRDMPMWGTVLNGPNQDKEGSELRIQALVRFVETIQAK